MPRSITGSQLREMLIANSSPQSEQDEDTFNPNIITKQEIEDYFDISKAEMMSNIYYRMKENCESSATGIFQKPESSAMFDFFELLKHNIDIRSYYKQKFKV